MNAYGQEGRDYGFVVGLLTGTFVGAGLAMWFAPRLASELRERVSESARSLTESASRLGESARSFGERASEQYQQASTRVGAAVDQLTRQGQDVQDDVAEAVVRGANEVARFASAAKSDRANDTRKHGRA